MFLAVSAIMMSLCTLIFIIFSVLFVLSMKLSIFTLANFFLFWTSMQINKEILCFLIVVALVTSCISIYSFFYLGMATSTTNFLWILSFFAFSMMWLILSNSICIYILGWDGLGASSFLLILFYNTLFSYRSGMATFLTNRLGDVFIILAFIVMSNKENILSNLKSYPMDNKLMGVAFALLVLGAATKSAQLPFSAWLPAAMAAPTPVSALVHSSTLVTAGIYLIYQFESLIDNTVSRAPEILSLMGIILSLLAGFMAFYESDLKKLVAMSTLSQLGILVYILFQKQSQFTLIHIMSHAFFKSLLFLVVGFLIILGMGYQDARTKTFTKINSMLATMLIFITSLSLMGFMFTPGFFSKDLILSSYPESGMNVMLFLILNLSCVLTVMYSAKSFIILMNSMHLKQTSSSLSMDKKFLTPCLFLLTVMMIFGFYFFNNIIQSEIYIESYYNKILGVIIIASGLIATIIFYKLSKGNKIGAPYKNIVEKFSQMTNMNWISNNFMSSLAKKILNPLTMEIKWPELLVEKKSMQIMSSNTVTLSKSSKKFSNMELVLMLMTMSLVFFFSSYNM